MPASQPIFGRRGPAGDGDLGQDLARRFRRLIAEAYPDADLGEDRAGVLYVRIGDVVTAVRVGKLADLVTQDEAVAFMAALPYQLRSGRA